MFTFKPPHPPQSLATLQIECVACKELFTLAEGQQSAQSNAGAWQHVLTAQPFVRLRYLPDRFLKTTRPQHRPHTFTQDSPEDPGSINGPIRINCPRCGADNRNWLHILQSFTQNLPQNFLPLGIGFLITCLLLLTATIRLWTILSLGQLAILFVMILLSGLLPLAVMPFLWRQEREYHNAGGFLPRGALSPTLRVGFALLLIFVFILPAFIYVAVPIGFDYVSDLLSPPATPSLPERIQQVREQIEGALGTSSADKSGAVESALVTIESLLKIKDPPTDLKIRSMSTLQIANQWVKLNEDSELVPKIAREVAHLEAFIAAQSPRVDKAFLKIWFKYVLASSLLASLCGWWTVTMYVGHVNRHLPRPLYYSLADMTRVVAWEVKRVLELPGDMSQVEWLDAERNELGGIDLIGIVRATPRWSQAATGGRLEPARRYEIMTDPWGRIVYVESRDIRVSAPVPPPEQGGDAAAAEREEVYNTLEKLFRPQSRYLSL